MAELTQLKVDVLVVGSDAGALAAKNAATGLPVVFTGVSDPVGLGLVSNLGRPGGHMTGVALAWDAAFGGKWLELLKELVPRMSHAAVLWSTALVPTFGKSLQDAGKARGVTVEMFQVTDADRFSAAFAAMSSKSIEGFIVVAEPLTVVHRARIAELAARERLPTVAGFGDFPRAGGLMGYGVSLPDMYAQAAVYVVKILKGAKPADLPVEQPTKLELVINAKTAKALGLTIPQAILLRADQVIE